MNMNSFLIIACAIVAVALSGCHYDEPYYPGRSHSHGSYHGESYSRGYYDGHDHGDYDGEHRAAHHAEHDYYDHGY